MSDTQDRRRAGTSSVIVLDVLLLLLVLAIAIHTIVVSRLRGVNSDIQQQLSFWQQRSDELCIPPDQRPMLPTLAKDADPLEQFKSLKALNEAGAKVWNEYKNCQEPISKPIPEALLHFKSGKFNEYEGNEEAGYIQINKYVEEFIGTHNQIYVIGHTDIRRDEEYNYQLSYDRALEVSTRIQTYLSTLGKERGTHYQIYAIGMGKSQLLEQKPGEPENDWLTNCRRLELEFRSLSRTNVRHR